MYSRKTDSAILLDARSRLVCAAPGDFSIRKAEDSRRLKAAKNEPPFPPPLSSSPRNGGFDSLQEKPQSGDVNLVLWRHHSYDHVKQSEEKEKEKVLLGLFHLNIIGAAGMERTRGFNGHRMFYAPWRCRAGGGSGCRSDGLRVCRGAVACVAPAASLLNIDTLYR